MFEWLGRIFREIPVSSVLRERLALCQAQCDDLRAQVSDLSRQVVDLVEQRKELEAEIRTLELEKRALQVEAQQQHHKKRQPTDEEGRVLELFAKGHSELTVRWVADELSITSTRAQFLLKQLRLKTCVSVHTRTYRRPSRTDTYYKVTHLGRAYLVNRGLV